MNGVFEYGHVRFVPLVERFVIGKVTCNKLHDKEKETKERKMHKEKKRKKNACDSDDGTWCGRSGRSVGNSVLKREKEIEVVFVACHGD